MIASFLGELIALVAIRRWPAQFAHNGANVSKLVLDGALAAAVQPLHQRLDLLGFVEVLSVHLEGQHLQVIHHAGLYLKTRPVFPSCHVCAAPDSAQLGFAQVPSFAGPRSPPQRVGHLRRGCLD